MLSKIPTAYRYDNLHHEACYRSHRSEEPSQASSGTGRQACHLCESAPMHQNKQNYCPTLPTKIPSIPGVLTTLTLLERVLYERRRRYVSLWAIAKKGILHFPVRHNWFSKYQYPFAIHQSINISELHHPLWVPTTTYPYRERGGFLRSTVEGLRWVPPTSSMRVRSSRDSPVRLPEPGCCQDATRSLIIRSLACNAKVGNPLDFYGLCLYFN